MIRRTALQATRLKTYERLERQLHESYPDDAQGFYAAQGHLRMRYGQDISDENVLAMKIEGERFLNQFRTHEGSF